MFQFILNLFLVWWYAFYSVLITIITGKLPKISVYHFMKGDYADYHFWELCSDENIQTDNPKYVSKEAKEKIIFTFLNHLTNDKNFTAPICLVDYPIFDGLEVVGTTDYIDALNKSYRNYLKTL